jgi:hypothetical protein
MEAELMPVVKAADLKAAFDLFRPLRVRCGKQGAFTVIPGELEALCTPGANVEALHYRETFLGLLLTMGEPPFLSPWIHDGYPDMKLFQVAASFPFPVPNYTDPRPQNFDFEGFIQQLNGV